MEIETYLTVIPPSGQYILVYADPRSSWEGGQSKVFMSRSFKSPKDHEIVV